MQSALVLSDDLAAVIRLIEQGREEELVGRCETADLEFKLQYVLDDERQKWELAKDVAAMSYSGQGGLIVIGFVTNADRESDAECVTAVHPIPQRMFDPQQHRQVIRDGCYPPPRGVSVTPYSRDGGTVLGVIAVPPQREADRPIMVVRMVEGDIRRGLGIGIPYREGPHTVWEPPGVIHRDLNRARITQASAKLPLRSQGASTSLREDVASATSDMSSKIEEFMGWTEFPVLLLAAVPAEAQRVPLEGFYDPDGILKAVTRPPTIREAGFSLAWDRPPQNIDGALVNATAGRTVLWVRPSGEVFAGAAGAPSFLTRAGGGPPSQEPHQRTINPTVLVEWTYLFCLFVAEELAPLVSGGWTLAARLRGAQSRPWSLRLLGGARRDAWEEGLPAGMDEWHAEVDATMGPGRDAYNILAGLYGVFGLHATQIPYTEDTRVVPEAIQAIE